MFNRSIVRRALVGLGMILLAGSASAQDSIKYKWNKGDVLHYRSTQETSGKMTAMGMERTTTQKQEAVQRFEVTDVAGDGAATMTLTILSMKAEMDQGAQGGKATFDSSKPADQQFEGTPALKPMMEASGAMVGEKLTVIIDSTGSVRKVEGMSKVLDKIQSKMGNANPMVARNLRSALNDESMRGSLERFFKVVPEKAVKTGDTWTSAFEQPIPGAGGRMKIDSAWTLAGSETLNGASVAKMTGTSKIDVAAPKEGEETLAPGMKTTITDGKGTGEAYFDTKAGQLAKSVVNMTLPIEISISSQQGQSMSAKNDTTSTFTFEKIAAPAAADAPAAPAGEPAKQPPAGS